MIRFNKKNIMRVSIIFFMLLSFVFSIWYYNQFYNSISRRKSFVLSDKISFDLATKISKEEPRLSFFNTEKIVIENKSLNKFRTVQKIDYVGNLNSMMNSQEYLNLDTSNSCVISKDVAISLFGQSDVVGLIVGIESKKFTIQKVEDRISNTIIVSTFDANNDYIYIASSDTLTSNLSQRTLNSYGLMYAELDSKLLLVYLNMLVIALLLIISFYLISMLENKRGLKRVIKIVSLALILIFLKYRFVIPMDWVPNKWSNTEYWTNFMLSRKSDVLILIQTSIPNVYTDIYILFGKSVFLLNLSFLLIAACILYDKGRTVVT